MNRFLILLGEKTKRPVTGLQYKRLVDITRAINFFNKKRKEILCSTETNSQFVLFTT